MELTSISIQHILTSIIVVIWYLGSTLIIFDFLIGLPALMQKVKAQIAEEATQELEMTEILQQIQPDEPQATFSDEPKATRLNSANSELSQTLVPTSQADEATLQYIQMTGCDIDDFESISDARIFLYDNVAWAIEQRSPAPVRPISRLQVQDRVTSPNIAKISKEVSSIEPEANKLTFEMVKGEFAKLNWTFQKHRSGHNRYRVNIDGHLCRFKTLSDALDWLAVSRKLIKVATATSNQ